MVSEHPASGKTIAKIQIVPFFLVGPSAGRISPRFPLFINTFPIASEQNFSFSVVFVLHSCNHSRHFIALNLSVYIKCSFVIINHTLEFQSIRFSQRSSYNPNSVIPLFYRHIHPQHSIRHFISRFEETTLLFYQRVVIISTAIKKLQIKANFSK